MKKILIIGSIIGVIVTGIYFSTSKASACWFCSNPSKEVTDASSIQKNIMAAVPVPQLTNSLERENVSKRAQIFNTPDKISYIYLVSFGKVMSFFTVKGKVSSLQSYMVPTERLVNAESNPCTYDSDQSSCYTLSAPDIDGTYGENVSGIFFFTTEGAYVEWKGDYMMSDQPLKLSTQPELVRQVK